MEATLRRHIRRIGPVSPLDQRVADARCRGAGIVSDMSDEIPADCRQARRNQRLRRQTGAKSSASITLQRAMRARLMVFDRSARDGHRHPCDTACFTCDAYGACNDLARSIDIVLVWL